MRTHLQGTITFGRPNGADKRFNTSENERVKKRFVLLDQARFGLGILYVDLYNERVIFNI